MAGTSRSGIIIQCLSADGYLSSDTVVASHPRPMRPVPPRAKTLRAASARDWRGHRLLGQDLIEETTSPVALDKIAGWILRQDVAIRSWSLPAASICGVGAGPSLAGQDAAVFRKVEELHTGVSDEKSSADRRSSEFAAPDHWAG